MKLFTRISLFSLVAILCFACSQKPARIISNSGKIYSKNSSYNKDKYRDLSRRVAIKSQQIEVVFGDTLYGISKMYQMPLRDLIRENDLQPPYSLFAGQLLTVPAPSFHKVKKGETIADIARLYKMNVDNVVTLNDLKSPYSLKAGQELRISKNVTKKRPKKVVASKASPKKKKDTSPGVVKKALDRLNHFSWPIHGTVISKFGPKSEGLYNDGINISAANGADVKASEEGTVAYVGNELKGYGNLVIIKHSGGWVTAYAHLSKAMVKRGQKVNKLEVIAKVGSSGNVSSSQLYFGLRKGRDAVNPANYLK